MPREIERKFLLEEPPPGLEGRERVEIEQGYLAISDDVEVRVRRAGDRRTLTVKRGAGESREEVEVALSAEALEALWPACGSARLEKRRYLVPLGDGLRAEVDVYGGPLDGLRVVEVEFPGSAEARAFEAPSWFGREVTGERRFANRALAVDGRPGKERGQDGRDAYRLERGEGIATGMRRVATGRAEKALRRLRGVGPGSSEAADAVHGVRKDMKKLRTALRLLREELGEEAFQAEDRRFRDAGRALSESRDAEVRLQTLDALLERSPDLGGEELASWRQELERDRDRALEGGNEIATVEAIDLIEAGRDRIEAWRLDGDWELIDGAVRRVYRQGRRAMRRAEAERSELSFHRWRKRSKDLWHLLRLLAGAWPEVLDPSAEEAHALADLLGDHHDLAVLRADLATRSLPDRAAERIGAAISARERELAAAAFERGHRLYAERPSAFRRRLRAYWRAASET